jgi:hypothetical protein
MLIGLGFITQKHREKIMIRIENMSKNGWVIGLRERYILIITSYELGH